MNKSLYTTTKDLNFPTIVYPDPVRKVTQYRSNLEQGYNINNIQALFNIEDQKINNFSLGYITKPNKLSNFVSVEELKQGIEAVTTRLEFNKGEDSTSSFLYIYKDDASTTTDSLPVGVRFESVGEFDNNYFFELEFIDSLFLRVKHNDGKDDFYLSWNEELNKLGFNRSFKDNVVSDAYEEVSDLFRYNLDSSGRLHLYKNNTQGEMFVLTYNNSNNILSVEMKQVSSSGLVVDGSNTISINNFFEVIDQTQNNDYISYKTGLINKLTIDTSKSLFDADGQYVFHVEYNNQDLNSNVFEMNFFTLDTNRSEYGFVKRGTNLVESLNVIPTVNYRNYTTFDTGNREEGGHTKMSIIYNFYDKDIFVAPGLTTVFNASETIFPFTQLNINDTTFVKNGSFSGPSPQISDKIYILQKQLSKYRNGRYLCTWLSANDISTPGVWVDRYYYPDAIEKKEALRDIPKYNISFDDTIDTTLTFSSAGRADINKAKFFDKRSDAVITPNCTIKYERLGTADINNIITTSQPILSGFQNIITFKQLRTISNVEQPYLGSIVDNSCEVVKNEALNFDGTFYTKLSVYEEINKTKEFTISFDAYIDPDKHYGFQLLGSNTNKGFGVFQDMTVTPFVHIAYDKTVEIYNTNNVKLNEIYFNSKVKDVYKRSALQDFLVTCESGEVYRVDPKGNKSKLEIQGIAGYINSCITEDYIYFLLINNVVMKLSLIDLEIEQVTYNEFEEYKDLVNWYENIFVYKDEVYLVPGCDKKMVWEKEDIVFYTLKAEGQFPGWYVIKHDLRTGPVRFLRTDCPVTDMEIEFERLSNNIVFAIENKLHRYRTSGQELEVIDYDDPSLWGLIEGTDDEISNLDNSPDLLKGGKILALDTVNEYVNGGVNSKRLITLLSDKDGNITLDEPSELVIPLSGITADNFTYTRLTNYNNINRLYDSKTLNFRLTLKNTYDSEDIRSTSINYDVNRIDAGFHTFTYTFDGVSGTATLFVDGILYETIDFVPGKYNLHDIFNDELYVGTVGFLNGTDLSTYIKQPGYYVIKDLRLKNMFIYNRAAPLSLIYALNLIDSDINEMVLSLPHGQRNNKTTIERFYKLGRHTSSKNIDIVVNNFNITDESILAQVKLNIMNDASSILPAGVTINNINFKQ